MACGRLMASPLLRTLLRLDARLRRRPGFVPLGPHAVALTRRGHQVFLLADDLSVTPRLALYGEWEPHVAGLLRHLLRPGQRVVEAGANVGLHTLGIAERIGPTGRLDAFEPVPEFHPLLERSLAANGLAGSVFLHQAALLDRAGEVEILQDPMFRGSGHLAIEHSSTRYSRRITATAVKLDTVLGDGAPLDLLRLDVEGTEALALRGAEAVLRRSPHIRVVLEWSPVMLRSHCDPVAEAE